MFIYPNPTKSNLKVKIDLVMVKKKKKKNKKKVEKKGGKKEIKKEKGETKMEKVGKGWKNNVERRINIIILLLTHHKSFKFHLFLNSDNITFPLLLRGKRNQHDSPNM